MTRSEPESKPDGSLLTLPDFAGLRAAQPRATRSASAGRTPRRAICFVAVALATREQLIERMLATEER